MTEQTLSTEFTEVRARALTAALEALARCNIPTDTQALLLIGDPMRGIRPGALDAAIAAALLVLFKAKFGAPPRRPDA